MPVVHRPPWMCRWANCMPSLKSPPSQCLGFPLMKEKRGLTLVLGWKTHLLSLCDHAPSYSLRGVCALHPNPATCDDSSLHPPWVMSQWLPAPWCLGGPAAGGARCSSLFSSQCQGKVPGSASGTLSYYPLPGQCWAKCQCLEGPSS